MGRSLVIDLEAPSFNNFRQVDHRTIQSIILKNVKYSLGKKSTLSSLVAPEKKWDLSKLQVGDWFSENQFYKLTADLGNKVDAKICNESNETYEIPKSQLYDMYSATCFETEEYITRTQIVELLLNARESVFTCTFNKKVTQEDVIEVLKSVKSQADLNKSK